MIIYSMEARRPHNRHIPFAVARDFLGETTIQIDAVEMADRQKTTSVGSHQCLVIVHLESRHCHEDTEKDPDG